MPGNRRVSQEERLAARLSDSPEQERCELILWIEADWRCEYWLLLAQSGVMRLYNGPDTVLEVPVTDPIAALREAKMWHDVVLQGGVRHSAFRKRSDPRL